MPLRDSLADGSFSSGSSSDSGFSTDDSVPDPGDEDDNRPPRERQPLPEGVDLSQARLGRGIKGGAFGTVSRVDGAQGAPPLVVKVPKGNNRAELEHEAEYYAKIGPHPSIAICLGMQKIGRQEGLVMEGIKGADMHKAMNRLEQPEKAGVVHADIRPDNAMPRAGAGRGEFVDAGPGVAVCLGAAGVTKARVTAAQLAVIRRHIALVIGAG